LDRDRPSHPPAALDRRGPDAALGCPVAPARDPCRRAPSRFSIGILRPLHDLEHRTAPAGSRRRLPAHCSYRTASTAPPPVHGSTLVPSGRASIPSLVVGTRVMVTVSATLPPTTRSAASRTSTTIAQCAGKGRAGRSSKRRPAAHSRPLQTRSP